MGKIACSHGRSHEYFTESLHAAVEKKCTFCGHEWNLSYSGATEILKTKFENREKFPECVEMGINAEKYRRNGTYFVITGVSAPYCSKFFNGEFSYEIVGCEMKYYYVFFQITVERIDTKLSYL